MIGLTFQLAQRSAELNFEDLPDNVVSMARLCLLDWLGVTVVGSGEPAPRILLTKLLPDPVSEGASVIGHGFRVSALQAALVNGTSSHVLDFDDVNTTLIGHPSVATHLPGIGTHCAPRRGSRRVADRNGRPARNSPCTCRL